MERKFFQNKSPNFDRLLRFGFQKGETDYTYFTHILSNQFEMRITVSSLGEIKTEIFDVGTGEPYTLHLVEDACGAFVGAIRAEYCRVLTEISDACFEKDVFKSPFAHKVIAYVRENYGDDLQYLWEKFPTNAVWRRRDNNKWYGILMALNKRKLGIDSDEIVDIIDLRIAPDAAIIDGIKYFPGYHMNKKSWFTVCLDGSVPIETIFRLIDESYLLANKR